jgi:hypothetical protein
MSDAKAEPIVTITAIITRADGTVEDLGVVASNMTMASPLREKLRLLVKREN